MTLQFTRNQYFMFGLLMLLIGAQFRLIDSVVLTDKSARFVTEKFGPKPQAAAAPLLQFASVSPAASSKEFRPPAWIGWCLIAVGAVAVLHSVVLRKPGG
jgi:hypothetical protein